MPSEYSPTGARKPRPSEKKVGVPVTTSWREDVAEARRIDQAGDVERELRAGLTDFAAALAEASCRPSKSP